MTRIGVMGVLLAGCTAEPFVLVDGARWRAADPAVAPMSDHASGAAPCLPAGWGPELGGLEVDTGQCPFAQLQQAALDRARAGDLLEIEWWHQTLAAESEGLGHLALSTADTTLWERNIQIPADASTYVDEVEIPVDIPRDTPIFLHLHNHGANTWNLFRIVVVPH